MNRTERCLWHAADGRCANCKAKRIRLDVLKIGESESCRGPEGYDGCASYVPRPAVLEDVP